MVVDNNVVELEVAVGKAHPMQVADAINNLHPGAGDFRARHATGHDNGEEVIGGILHHFVPMVIFTQDVEGLDDVFVVKGGANTELSSDLFGVLLLALPGVAVAELLDGEGYAVRVAFDEANRAASTGPEDAAELAIARRQAVVISKGDGGAARRLET